jgi:hypothetical protein
VPAPGIRNLRSSADPDDISAQMDLIGVPKLMIGEEPPAAPNECLFVSRGFADVLRGL